MSEAPFMPKATAVWLVENTTLTFKQIAEFCNLHELEIKGIADGDVELSFEFNRTIKIPSNYVLNIAVARAEIPVSYYSFDFTWEFQLFWGVGGVEFQVDVPQVLLSILQLSC